VDVTMPQLGETVTEGTITRWFKQVGESVAVDEPLFEVSTDKVDSEVPSPTAGVVSEILVAEGDTVDVGARLAVISDSATVPAPAAPPTAAPSPPPAPLPAPVSAQPPSPEPRPAPAWAPVASAARTPAPPAPAPASAPVSNGPGPDTTAAVTSPLVRHMIAEQGLDPAQIRGTGEGGRITRNDVVNAGRGQTASVPTVAAPSAPAAVSPPPAPAPAAPPAAVPMASPAPAPAPPAPAPSAPAPSAPAPSAPAEVPVVRASGDEMVPFDNIRRRTAEHMVRSKATSAHVYTSVRVDFERVERARRANQAAWKAEEGFSLTYLPFIVRAFCDVVHDFPHVNASVDGDSLVVHRDLHLGIAVDLEFKGLVAPVIRNADGKRLRLIAREIRDLAARAKSKQLGPDEVVGGTFTITNMGPFGTALTLPIINQPQVAIMATDGIRKEPVVLEGPDGDDTIAIHHVGMLALAWDHRAFDGAYAASFLNEVRIVLETRDWDAELA
jgi:pyruvate dehydrogenase E2 component (dihydrolipoamide acetyltransferase)